MVNLIAWAVWPTLGWVFAPAAVALAVYLASIAIKRWRRSRFAEYAFQVNRFELADDGTVEYAQWLHPKESPKPVVQSQVSALRRFIRPGDTVLDIGAHTGDTTIHYALAAGATGCTLALEPNPYVYKVLAQNASMNRTKTNIVPLNFAATEADGFFTFHYSDGAYCNGGYVDQIEDTRHGHRHRLEVRGCNLENYLRRHHADRLSRLSFVKIDTEGYDRQVIESIMGILQEFRPVVVCEVYRRLNQAERESLFDVLARAGYECHRHTAADDLVGAKLGRDELMNERHFDMIALPGQRGLAQSA